jgi:hypothetical protein
MNKILEEVGKSFGRHLFEAIVSHGAITLIQSVVTDGVDYYKNKKLIEFSRATDINKIVINQQPEGGCSCGCNDENFEEEEYEEEVQPEPKPAKKSKKSKKQKGRTKED